MKIAGETPYETDLNVWMQLEKELKNDKPVQTNVGYILKDRSDTINAKSFSMPKYRNFRAVIRFIQGLPVGDIATESKHENFTPGSDADYWERQRMKKIEIEKIESIFDENNLGSPRSADDKRVKTKLIKKVFGTTSKTEIENMKPEVLSFLRAELEEVFSELKEVENADEYLDNYKSPTEANKIEEAA